MYYVFVRCCLVSGRVASSSSRKIQESHINLFSGKNLFVICHHQVLITYIVESLVYTDDALLVGKSEASVSMTLTAVLLHLCQQKWLTNS